MNTVTFKLKRYSPVSLPEPSYIVDCDNMVISASLAVAKFKQQHKAGQYAKIVVKETEVLHV